MKRDKKHTRRDRPHDVSPRRSDSDEQTDRKPMRLNRYIALAGVCSRREADRLIEAGAVRVNEEVVTQLGTRIAAGDEVYVRGRRIRPERDEYVLLNKPTDTITTVRDERGRQTVMDLVDESALRVSGLFPVGRLDRHTTGVLLLTNDGILAHRLTHPSFEIEKIYLVRTSNPVSEAQLEELLRGVELEDGIAKVDRIHKVPGTEANEVGLSIHEGRNRQIRRMFAAIGSDIVRLERIRYAGLTSSGIRRGKWRRLSENEVARLYRAVKL